MPELPPDIEVTKHPRAVVEHLVAMKVINCEYAPPNLTSVTKFTCQVALQQAINEYPRNFHLATYQLQDDQIPTICQKLEEMHDARKDKINIVKALVELYLYGDEVKKATVLLEEYRASDNESLKHHLTLLVQRVLDQDPAVYDLYDLLASWATGSDICKQIRLQAAWEALKNDDHEVALKFCEKIDPRAPFIDRLVHLYALAAMGKSILPVLFQFADRYALYNEKLEEIKVCKQIAYREPSSEIFARIIRVYRNLDKLEKLPRWYNKWRSHLIAQEKWQEAEAVALEAKG